MYGNKGPVGETAYDINCLETFPALIRPASPSPPPPPPPPPPQGRGQPKVMKQSKATYVERAQPPPMLPLSQLPPPQ